MPATWQLGTIVIHLCGFGTQLLGVSTRGYHVQFVARALTPVYTYFSCRSYAPLYVNYTDISDIDLVDAHGRCTFS